MALSPPVNRKPYHHRKINACGYFREDRLWDIEGHLRDEKTYDFETHDRGEMRAGDAVHDMHIRLTIDESYIVHAIEVAMDSTPFAYCPHATINYQRLVGLRLGAGMRKQIRERLPNHESCTHINELLTGLATVAFQTIYASKKQAYKDHGIALEEQQQEWMGTPEKPDKPAKKQKPAQIDSCHSLATSSPVVKRLWPDYYEEDKHKPNK